MNNEIFANTIWNVNIPENHGIHTSGALNPSLSEHAVTTAPTDQSTDRPGNAQYSTPSGDGARVTIRDNPAALGVIASTVTGDAANCSYANFSGGIMRYPGGKKKLSKKVLRLIRKAKKRFRLTRYAEPFAGAGSIFGTVLNADLAFSEITINDLDLATYSIWNSVFSEPDRLIRLVQAFTPTTDAFYGFKQDLLSGSHSADRTLVAFKKIAIHQISYSGLGTMAGGPLGGREQRGEFRVTDRWNPKLIVQKIMNFNYLMSRVDTVNVTNDDFSTVLRDATWESFIYLDPNYWVAGNTLYEMKMTEDDHRRLARLLRENPGKFLLSYDDTPQVRKLYGFANISTIVNTNTIVTANGRANKKTELLISNF